MTSLLALRRASSEPIPAARRDVVDKRRRLPTLPPPAHHGPGRPRIFSDPCYGGGTSAPAACALAAGCTSSARRHDTLKTCRHIFHLSRSLTMTANRIKEQLARD